MPALFFSARLWVENILKRELVKNDDNMHDSHVISLTEFSSTRTQIQNGRQFLRFQTPPAYCGAKTLNAFS